jgi:hypothetical protein
MADRKRLFEVAPADFTKARDALVRELREQGKTDEAKEVAALRKPPVGLWIANQLARLAPKDVEALIDATARVRKAQFSGSGGDALREAMRGQREALAKLAEVAARAAKNAESAMTLALQRRVQNTVQAAASSEPDALREGSLLHELDPSGFEALLGAAPVAASPSKPDAHEERRRSKEEKERKEREAKELHQAEQFAKRALAEADTLEAQAVRAEQTAAEARKQAEEAKRAAAAAAARALGLRRQE